MIIRIRNNVKLNLTDLSSSSRLLLCSALLLHIITSCVCTLSVLSRVFYSQKKHLLLPDLDIDRAYIMHHNKPKGWFLPKLLVIENFPKFNALISFNNLHILDLWCPLIWINVIDLMINNPMQFNATSKHQCAIIFLSQGTSCSWRTGQAAKKKTITIFTPLSRISQHCEHILSFGENVLFCICFVINPCFVSLSFIAQQQEQEYCLIWNHRKIATIAIIFQYCVMHIIMPSPHGLKRHHQFRE